MATHNKAKQHQSLRSLDSLVYFPCSSSNESLGESVALPKGLEVTKIIAGLNSEAIKQELEVAADTLDIPIEQIKLSDSSYDLEV